MKLKNFFQNKKGRLLTCASSDNKLLQTKIYVQIFLKDWKLEMEKRNKEQGGVCHFNRLCHCTFVNM